MAAFVTLLTLAACGGSSDRNDSRGNGGSGGAATQNVFVDEVGPDPTQCLPRALVPDTEGRVSCGLLVAAPSAPCSCSTPGHAVASADLRAAVLDALEQAEHCGESTGVGCESYCVCEVTQLTGSDLASCQNDVDPSASGFCYVDPAQGTGNPELVADCAPNQQRKLRVTGQASAAFGDVFFVGCT